MRRYLIGLVMVALSLTLVSCDGDGGGNGGGNGQVTSVSTSVSPAAYVGICPKVFKFTGVITTDGVCEVTYRWAHEPYVNDEHTISFAAAGSQTVTYSWKVSGWLPANEQWLDLITSSPNLVIAMPIASFKLTCLLPQPVDK